MTQRRTTFALASAVAALLVPSCSKEEPARTPPLHFTDASATSGLDMTITCGRRPWSQILEVKGVGLALIDYDNDDDFDLLVPNGATLDSASHGPGARLYRNDGSLRFTDVTRDVGLDFHRWSYGVAVGDVDGDGFDDVFVACYGRNALLKNDGGKRFVDASEAAGVEGDAAAWSTAAAFGDIDRDGDLDLYVANFLEFDPSAPPDGMNFVGVPVFGGPMGLPPQKDVLYVNAGDGTFVDESFDLGCRAAPPSYGLGVVILDFDGDARPEIFVGNDSGANFLFHRTDDGPFTDVGVASGIGTNIEGGEQATMGIAIGDVDGNGMPDVFSSNFMNDTNTLHVNLGDCFFEDRTQRFGLAVESRPFLGWASYFADFDHDGDEDLLVFNGHVYPEEITEPHHWGHRQTPLLYEKDGGRFHLASADRAGAWLAEAHCDRSAVFGDLDRDGDVDVVVAEPHERLRLLANDGARAPSVVIALADSASKNRRGLGARVELTAGEQTQVRWIHTGGSYEASNAPEAHFGVEPGRTTGRVTITWPDGARQGVDVDVPGRHVVSRRP